MKQSIAPQILSTSIRALSPEGRGIANLEKVTFIEGALPDETVKYQLIKQRSSFDEGICLEILEASVDRVAPPCLDFGRCGGCTLQHLKTDAQILFKEQGVKEQIEHLAKLQASEWAAPIVGPAWHYRRKARLGVKFVAKKDKVIIAYREKKTNKLCDMTHCHTLRAEVADELSNFAKLLYGLKARNIIPQIEVAVGDNGMAWIVRHLEPLETEDEMALINFAKQKQIQLYLQAKGPDSVTKIWPLEGPSRLQYYLPSFDLKFNFHPNDFIQINAIVNQKMVKQAIDWLDLQAEDKVLDLFCGLGNFSLPLAKHSSNVLGIEGSQDMVERARENALLNNLTNTHFIEENLFAIPSDAKWLDASFDKILIDPPRSGAQELINQMVKFKAQRIVYVSCNPASLARDLALWCQQGYRLEKMGTMDMFAQTQHVEAMALLVRI